MKHAVVIAGYHAATSTQAAVKLWISRTLGPGRLHYACSLKAYSPRLVSPETLNQFRTDMLVEGRIMLTL